MKALRQERNWSQEHLAEVSGLSLRTIQRIESTNKASYGSMAALASVFRLDVISIQRELAMDKASSDWKNRPAWIRALFVGSTRINKNRRQHMIAERFAFVAGLLFVGTGLLAATDHLVPADRAVMLLAAGSALLLCAYLLSLIIRAGDEYAVWRWVDPDILHE